MSRCNYNSKRLIPAPQVTLSKQYQSTEDGTKIGSQWNIVINGTCVAFMGSPNSSGTFWTSSGFPPDEVIENDSRLASVIRKQEAIRTLFAEDGHVLEFQSEDGSQPMKCNPKVQSIVFSEGQWYDRFTYAITLTADIIYVNGIAVSEDSFTDYIESASENWQIDTVDEPQSDSKFRTYKLTHNVSAKGKRFYDDSGALVKEAWEQAKSWVTAKMGYDASVVTGSLVSGVSTGNYNHLINESLDEYTGSYSITESWLLADSNAIETYEISSTTSSDSVLTKVSIDGTITGLSTTDTGEKYTNALAKYATVESNLYTRVSSAVTGLPRVINTTPLSTTISKNPTTGVVKYNLSYDNRPSNLLTGAIVESINISDSMSNDFIVPIFILGRIQGPILQNLNTSKEQTRAVSIDAVFPLENGDMSSTMETIADNYKPVSTTSQVYVQDKNKTRDIKTGRQSYNITWIWE